MLCEGKADKRTAQRLVARRLWSHPCLNFNCRMINCFQHNNRRRRFFVHVILLNRCCQSKSVSRHSTRLFTLHRHRALRDEISFNLDIVVVFHNAMNSRANVRHLNALLNLHNIVCFSFWLYIAKMKPSSSSISRTFISNRSTVVVDALHHFIFIIQNWWVCRKKSFYNACFLSRRAMRWDEISC